ncbi:hypothetical protein HN51_000159 [Arachis hypogaea]|uniref:SHSP domain-containing protein n=2 Tax=Arachis TaxID=3817 RepID=A0A445EWX0_ARAHY|nr:small heat shock protein, chloroplastic [Arachis duranensis]XP_025688095.1 small heat shock protein, chloroplastic isoform X2 [Arachis hypogaea]QHO47977.1 Small heat shock protein [Arachis hypogaea]RYR79928.1 hypothetical protein Ahy_A01g004719 [Arachis hypogaea]
MASTLPNMSFCAHPSSIRVSNTKLLPFSRARNVIFHNNVKATAGNDASFQRTKQHQQLQPKMNKGLQSSPKVLLLNQFPEARTMRQMLDTMERIVENPLSYSSASPLIITENGEYNKGKLPWLIKEGKKDYKMRFNMPGMNKNDVKIWVEENMLVVKAEKEQRVHHEGQENGSEGHEDDWPASSYGRYNDRIALPENIEFDKIKAQVKDGVLYITVPKASNAAKKIDIDVE